MTIAGKRNGVIGQAFATLALAVLSIVASGAGAETTWGPLIIGPGETLAIGAGEERRHIGRITVSGGRIEVNAGKLFLTGTLTIRQGGAVVFDAGEFHHDGEDTHVIVGGDESNPDDGLFAFRNGGRYHWVQTYGSQHELHARGNARIELAGTKINADAGTISIRLFDNAVYTADGTETEAGSWVTWYMKGRSQLWLNRVVNGGDVVFYDAARIDVRDTLGIMPWLYFPRGSIAELTFPEASHCLPGDCPLVSKLIDSTTVAGIEWSVNVQNSGLVLWGFNSYPGSRVTVRDSALTMAMVRLAEDNAYLVPGEFRNDSSYDDKTFTSVPDRLLRLIRTSVRWWKLDVVDTAQAWIDRVTFSEMMVKNSARALVTNSICEGQTINLGAQDDAYVYFHSGEVWTYVSVWDRALMVLDRSLVDYEKGRTYQQRNIAHNRSRLYALNSELRSQPEAMEWALVTFALLGTYSEPRLETTVSTWTPVTGSAWIAAGSASRVSFERWVLAIRAPEATGWTNFATGTSEVRDAPLGWLPPWLIPQAGEYEVRLTLFVRGDDPATPYPTWAFPATKKLLVR